MSEREESARSSAAVRQRKKDRALVEASLDGDSAALSELAARLECVPRILAILNRRMGNALSSHDLADLAQDVLVVIWSKLATFEGRAKLETWSSRFCFREYMNQLRRKGRMMVSGQRLDGLIESVAAPEPVSADRVERKVARMHRGLNRLGPPEASVIRLKHFESLTFREIGGVLEISPNTAKTYYYRGIAWLREHLASRELEEQT